MIFSTLTFATMLSLATCVMPTIPKSDAKNTLTGKVSSRPPNCSNTDANGCFLPNVIFPECTAALNPESLRNMVIQGMACACDVGTLVVPKRDDYHYTPGMGAHKLHTRSATFDEARKICSDEGGHLAVINSLAEERVLLDLFNKSRPIKGSKVDNVALIGIHDLYNEGEWVTIYGDSLHKTGYTNWSDYWGGQPDNGGGIQHCGALMKVGGMDDVTCNSPYGFFCEITTT